VKICGGSHVPVSEEWRALGGPQQAHLKFGNVKRTFRSFQRTRVSLSQLRTWGKISQKRSQNQTVARKGRHRNTNFMRLSRPCVRDSPTGGSFRKKFKR